MRITIESDDVTTAAALQPAPARVPEAPINGGPPAAELLPFAGGTDPSVRGTRDQDGGPPNAELVEAIRAAAAAAPMTGTSTELVMEVIDAGAGPRT